MGSAATTAAEGVSTRIATTSFTDLGSLHSTTQTDLDPFGSNLGNLPDFPDSSLMVGGCECREDA